MVNQTYRIIIEPDGDGFHGYVPALKGCHTWGKTISETKVYLREALELFIESLIEHGDSIPTDESFEAFETVSVRQPTRRRIRSRQYA